MKVLLYEACVSTVDSGQEIDTRIKHCYCWVRSADARLQVELLCAAVVRPKASGVQARRGKSHAYGEPARIWKALNGLSSECLQVSHPCPVVLYVAMCHNMC